jgi:hypothetical protein
MVCRLFPISAFAVISGEAFFTTQQAMRKKYAPYYWEGFTLVQ